ncbi:MAG: hypothetical protein K2W85_04875 [Phycisphaerales bacterium]|nr:hypothetical protein [Phycisphaerales bacterium]
MPDYIPRSDAEYAAYMQHFVPALDYWWSRQGLDPGTLDELLYAAGDFDAAYAAHIAQQAAAEGARHAKDAARARLTAAVRPLVSFVQSYPATTDAARAELGITIRPPKGTPARTPSSRPLALVESGQRLTHQLRLVDESTPTRRARPAGVLGAEVWVKLVAPPNADTPAPTDPARDPSSFTFLTMTTRPSFRAEFKAGEGGKTAVYMARWINTRGEKGPWSEITTATVAA